MSFQDRRYDDGPRAGFLGGHRPTATLWIIGISVVVMVVSWAAGGGARGPGTGAVQDLFELRTDRPFEIWRWVTYGFLHGGVFHLFWNMLMVFFIGRFLETWLGPKRLTGVYLGLVAFSALGFFAQSLLQRVSGGAIGASGAALGLVVLFGTRFPRMEIMLFGMIPMRAWALAAVFVGIDLLSVIANRGAEPTARGIHLAGALGGFFLGYFGPRMAVWRDAAVARREAARRDAARRTEESDRAELDRVLAKIREEGMDALSAREREFLRGQSEKLKGARRR